MNTLSNAIIRLLDKKVCTLDTEAKDEIKAIIESLTECEPIDIATDISDIEIFSTLDSDTISVMVEERIIEFIAETDDFDSKEGIVDAYKNHLGWFVDTGFKDDKIYTLGMLNDEIEKLLETKIKASMVLNMPNMSQIHSETCSRIDFLKLVRKTLINKMSL